MRRFYLLCHGAAPERVAEGVEYLDGTCLARDCERRTVHVTGDLDDLLAFYPGAVPLFED